MCNKGGVILDPSQNHCMDMENMLYRFNNRNYFQIIDMTG